MPQNKPTISRTRFANDIVCEFAKPVRQSKKAIILIPGLPSLPDKPKLIEYYAERGYWCFLPRLRGTWESGGRFLDASPEEDYKLVINNINKSFVDLNTRKKIKQSFSHVDVVGGSFGGTAAVLLSRLKVVRNAVALAPVVDWSVEGPDELHKDFRQYIDEAFGMAYRGSKARFRQMLNGDFYNPVEQTGYDSKKLLIIQCRDDKVVPPQPVMQFSKEYGLSLKLHKSGGHLGLSDVIDVRYRRLINQFLNIRG